LLEVLGVDEARSVLARASSGRLVALGLLHRARSDVGGLALEGPPVRGRPFPHVEDLGLPAETSKPGDRPLCVG
jgi:hypothetical protein